MRQVEDSQLSKRPIQTLEESDIQLLQDQIERLVAAKRAADEQVEARKDPRWIALLDSNMKRLQEIAMKRMNVPVDQTLQHAEICGQFNERLMILREIESWGKESARAEGAIKRLLETIAAWRKKKKTT